MKITSRRATALLAATLVIGTPSAVVLLSAGPAQAASDRLFASVTKLQASGGTCMTFSVTPINQFGVQSTVPDSVTVELVETPNSNGQDLDFCAPVTAADTYQADRPAEDPSYNPTNGGQMTPSGGNRQFYKAGGSLTKPGSYSNGGQPDVAAKDSS